MELEKRTRNKVAHSRVNHYQLLLGNWNILTLTGKELELVEEAKRYHLDIVGVTSGSSSILELIQLLKNNLLNIGRYANSILFITIRDAG